MSTIHTTNTDKTAQVRQADSPDIAALKAVEAVEHPDTPEAHKILVNLAQYVATDDTISGLSKSQKEAEDAARGFRVERDSLLAFQGKAIRSALKAGYKGTVIAETFGVSNQTVSYQKGGMDWRRALVEGGAKAAEVPSPAALASKLQNLPTGTKRADVVKAAKSTGAYVDPTAKPDPGTAPTFTAAQTLAKVQAALDAVKHTKRADGDAATWAKVQETVDALADMTAEQTVKAA